MAVMKTPDTKSMVENNMVQVIPSSPVPSYVGSQDSHSLLLPSVTQVIKEEARPKKKKTVVFGTKVLRQRRLKNALWLLLLSSLFALVVCVVITLANSFQDGFFFKGFGLSEGVVCNPFGRCESKTEEDNKSPITHIKNPDYPAGFTQQCIHQRALWEGGSYNSEIIHDLKTKWSALVDHNEQKCLLFAIHWEDLIGCPIEYPWFLDMRVGIPVCRTILDRIAPIRRVMRHILDENVQNLTSAGYITSRKCFKYKTAIVDKVIVQYFDINNNRVAKRSVRDSLQQTQSMPGLNEFKETAEDGVYKPDVGLLLEKTDAVEGQQEGHGIEAAHHDLGNLETQSTEDQDFIRDFFEGLEKKLTIPTSTASVILSNAEDGLPIDDGVRFKRAPGTEARKNAKRFPAHNPGRRLKNTPTVKKQVNGGSKLKLRHTRESERVFAEMKERLLQNHKDLLVELMSENFVHGKSGETNHEPLRIKGKKRNAVDKSSKMYQDALQILRKIVQNTTVENVVPASGQRSSAIHDFVYGKLIPEVSGHWELVLSNINEDGRTLLSQKFDKIPHNLVKVNQFLRPLMQEVKDAIQSAVNSEIKNLKNITKNV